MSNFLNDLNDLLDPTPQTEDPDDTTAKLVSKEGLLDDGIDTGSFSKLKAQAMQDEFSKKYQAEDVVMGKSESEDDDSEEVSGGESEDGGDDMSDIEDDLNGDADSGEGLDDDSEIEDDMDSDMESGDVQLFSADSGALTRGKARKQQLELIDCLYTCRIKLQKVLQAEEPESVERINEIIEKYNLLEKELKFIQPESTSALIEQTFDKTKLLGSFSKMDTSPNQQIESIVSDRQRLVKRTQKLRSSGTDEYDVEQFDDTDFYQQLLKQVIMSKSYNPDSNDPTEITRNWMKLQEGKKKKRSREVTDYHQRKGKKINYKIHKKLVNFTAPDDRAMPTYTHEGRNALFCSLFQ